MTSDMTSNITATMTAVMTAVMTSAMTADMKADMTADMTADLTVEVPTQTQALGQTTPPAAAHALEAARRPTSKRPRHRLKKLPGALQSRLRRRASLTYQVNPWKPRPKMTLIAFQITLQLF